MSEKISLDSSVIKYNFRIHQKRSLFHFDTFVLQCDI